MPRGERALLSFTKHKTEPCAGQATLASHHVISQGGAEAGPRGIFRRRAGSGNGGKEACVCMHMCECVCPQGLHTVCRVVHYYSGHACTAGVAHGGARSAHQAQAVIRMHASAPAQAPACCPAPAWCGHALGRMAGPAGPASLCMFVPPRPQIWPPSQADLPPKMRTGWMWIWSWESGPTRAHGQACGTNTVGQMHAYKFRNRRTRRTEQASQEPTEPAGPRVGDGASPTSPGTPQNGHFTDCGSRGTRSPYCCRLLLLLLLQCGQHGDAQCVTDGAN